MQGNINNGQLGRGATAGNQGYANTVSAQARAMALHGGNYNVGSMCIINWAASNLDSTVSCWGATPARPC